MASRKKIKLCCDVTVRDVLCTAIREYAHAAYPEGGSECAQVARYTLLELAADIDAGITDDGETVSNTSVKQALADLIADEDPAKPFSDARIVTELEKKGVHIARRTIAKYRDELGIPSSPERKYFA